MCAKRTHGFKVIQLRLTEDCHSSHELFVKEHLVQKHDEDKPSGRTLFIVNVPPYIDEDRMRKLFQFAGAVKSVCFQNFPDESDFEVGGFKMCFVVFINREALLNALTVNILGFNKANLKTGIDEWIQNYNSSICNADGLSREITEYMRHYDKIENKKKNKKDTDEDGWTVVAKKGRTPGLSRKESVVVKLKEKKEKKLKQKELKNFYTFQIRENKMKSLAQLRQNYEEAKAKVNLMKSARVFKPY
ncbi:ribosomal RNA-processing protein 7 homolog A [Cylas formicarius]|uniref:ribosomal RNA-processing protein 7 homolog A n=1 Tax=Cylas formicarius TaxID=197179 RepID=UPI0029589F12|nr:ribosomal RNA-processing protein 7 homolog A [Cylas formicarius]